MSLRSPLGRALGHGAAKEGVAHWLDMRYTSIALVPLGIWFLFSVLTLPDLGYKAVVAWVARPFNAVLLVLFVAATLRHSALGLQVVIEDYVHGKGARFAALTLSRFAHVLVAAFAIAGVLKLAFGGRA